MVKRILSVALSWLLLGTAPLHAAEITTFSPQGEHRSPQQVRVTFSSSMIRFGDIAAADPLQWSCQIDQGVNKNRRAIPPALISLDGKSHWIDDKTWVFDIQEAPLANTVCRFTTQPGLRDLQGQAVAPRSYRFQTGRPTIVRHWPMDDRITEDQAFVLEFNSEVSNTLPNLTALYCLSSHLSEKIPVTRLPEAERGALIKHLDIEKASKRIVALRCQQRVPSGGKLTLVYVRDKGVVNKFQFDVNPSFTAKLECQRSSAKADCIPLEAINLYFSAPLAANLAEKIRLRLPDGSERLPDQRPDQALGSVFDKTKITVDRVRFSPPFPPQSKLTLQLPQPFVDEMQRPLGNASLFPLTIVMADYPPLAKFSAAPFGIVESGADAAVPLTLRGIEILPRESVQLQARVLRLSDDQSIMTWLNRVMRYHETSIRIEQPQHFARESVLSRRLRFKKRARRQVDIKQATSELPMIETRRLSLLDKESKAQPLFLPTPTPTPTQKDHPTTWPFEVIGLPVKEPGFYIYEVQSQLLGKTLLAQNAPMYVRTAALVTNLAVHFKRAHENAAVWVTTLDKGQPVNRAKVRVYDCQRALLWQGETNSQGIAMIDSALIENRQCNDSDLSGLLITARAQDAAGREDISFVRSTWNEGIESWRFPFPTFSPGEVDVSASLLAHTVLDRTLFRAGQTVSMKHFLRKKMAQGLALLHPQQLPQQLRIVHDGSGQEVSLPLNWRDGRYADSTFTLPEQAKLGQYTLYLERKGSRNAADIAASARPELDGYTLESGHFRVEAFQLPVMRGVINAPNNNARFSTENTTGVGAIPLDISLMWGNGGPAKNWPVEVNAMLSRRYSTPQNYSDFSFYPPAEKQDVNENKLDGKVVLNKAALKLDKNGYGEVVVRDLPKLDRAYDLLSEVVYTDPNGKVQTISKTIPLWPAALQLGVNVNHDAYAGGPLHIKVVALDINDKPIANQSVTVRGLKHHTLSTRKRLVGGFYAWQEDEKTEDKGVLCMGKTDAHGYLFCKDVTVQEAGNLELIAQASDKQGNRVQSAQQIWISQRNELWFGANNHDRIDIIPDKSDYAPGEIARFQVRMPFRQATAWVAIEREGIVQTQLVTLNGKDPTFDIKIAPHWAPNVYVSVLAVRGRVTTTPWYSFFTWGWQAPRLWWQAWRAEVPQPTATVDLARPSFKYGIAQIRVGDKANQLKVEITPERNNYRIRQQAQVQIKVKLPNGRPAPAGSEVVFAAVDEALLALQPNHSWELLQAMYKDRRYGVETATAQLQVVGKRHYGRKALPPGGGGGQAPTRELFDTLLIWQPRVVLDAQGSATVKVPINDSLTRFRLVAVADVGQQWFGHGSSTIDVSQDLQISSGLPAVVREGDQFHATMTLRNGSTRTLNVRATLAPSVSSKGTFATLAPQIVNLPAGESRVVSWPVTIPTQFIGALGNQSKIKWTFSAEEITSGGNNAAEDKIKQSKVSGGASDLLSVTQTVDPVVPITVQQAMLQRVNKNLDVVVALPPALARRGGVQVKLQSTLGQALPLVRQWFEHYPYVCFEQRTSVALGLDDKARWQKLMNELPLYLDQAGLLSYFPVKEGEVDRGSDVLTSYVLAVADEAGYVIPEALRRRMLAGLVAFVDGRLQRRLPNTNQDAVARRLSAMATLARYQAFVANMLDVIPLQTQNWRTAMLIDWLTVLERAPSIPQREARIKQASQLLRSRMTYQGARIIFNQDQNDDAWWLMGNGDVDAAKLLLAVRQLPDWQADMPRLLMGLLARQQQGRWQTTVANVWGSLALAKFSKQFEAVPVEGETTLRWPGVQARANWSHDEASAFNLLPWPPPRSAEEERANSGADPSATLSLVHKGAGAPWATITSTTAIPLHTPRYAGYTVDKVLTPVMQKVAGQYHVGDIVKVSLTVMAQSEMTWVVVDDPIPAGTSLLGDGLGRDSLIAQQAMQESVSLVADYVERHFSAYRAYFGYIPRGRFKVEYTLRINTPGEFNLPPTRVEAMYAPDVFGMLPNPVFKVGSSN